MTLVTVTGDSVSHAWARAASELYGIPGKDAFHTVVHITRPTVEDRQVRQAVDGLMQTVELPLVSTVSNTIFPSAVALRSSNHSELSANYLAMLPRIKAFPGNHLGTYFGRLVAYPSAAGKSVDQIADLIRKLKEESAQRGPKTARYAVSIYAAGVDNSAMGFPCLSHCSFQLNRDGRVHLLAQYRSQYMVRRAYGNYLGLGRLLSWVATQAELQPGQLTVVSGYAKIEQSAIQLGRLLSSLA